MKRFLLAVVILSCATVLTAGSLDRVFAKISNVSMDASKSRDITSKITGWLERIDCYYANGTASVSVVVLASNDLTGIATTLLTLHSVSNNTSYIPRRPVQTTDAVITTTNGVDRFVLFNEVIHLTVTNAVYTNQNVTAVVIYERP